jgi:exocyst complex component 7
LLPIPSQIASAFNLLLAPLLKLFNNTLTSLVGLIKRSLHKFTFLALAAYESLLNLQPRWEDLISRRGGDTRKDTNDFKEGTHTLRAVCLRSFPEFLADIKLGSMGKGGELVTTGLADFSISVSLRASSFAICCSTS